MLPEMQLPTQVWESANGFTGGVAAGVLPGPPRVAGPAEPAARLCINVSMGMASLGGSAAGRASGSDPGSPRIPARVWLEKGRGYFNSNTADRRGWGDQLRRHNENQLGCFAW